MLCIELPATLRYFRVVILIQIGVERNERVIEKIALDPDLRGVAQDGAHLAYDLGDERGTGGHRILIVLPWQVHQPK